MNPAYVAAPWRWAMCLAMLIPSVPAAAQLAISPTTTLSAETSNNTSANGAFVSQKNGNAGASNVSKLSLRNLLYANSTTKIYAAVMPWFGRPDHMPVGYTSSDPAQITAQVNDMISRGVQGAVVPWYGPDSSIQSAMAVNFTHEAEARGGAFEIAIMIDVGAVGAYAQKNGCDVTSQLIADVNQVASSFFASPAYSRIGGRPVLFFFGVEAYYIDWAQVRAAAPGDPAFMIRNATAFGQFQADGGYAWVEIDPTNPYNMGQDYLESFYGAAQQSSAKDAVGSTYKGFNDTLAAWSSNRVLDQQCGRTWLETFSRLNARYSSSHQLRAVQLVTWNDYEEGTELETGIDNCAIMRADISAGTLKWAAEFSDSTGTESTIHHYAVFASSDGEHLMRLTDVPAGTHSLDLSQYQLAPGNYILYVEAVGQPSIVNRMSNAAWFNPADQPPVASLAVTPRTGTVSTEIKVSGDGSFDPDGSIASAVINFGDGTPAVAGMTATHIYRNAGHFMVTMALMDNARLSASASARVTITAGEGVVIVSPGANSTLDPPVHVLATGLMSKPVTAMQVKVDGGTIYWAAVSILDTDLKIGSGTHDLTVIAQDSTGATSSASTTVTVSPNDLPPAAALSVAPFGGGRQVMACTAPSTDSDGFIMDSQVDFGDGAILSGPTALHTYTSPGTYTVTATVVDNLGLRSTTSSKVTVGAGGPDTTTDFGLALNTTAATVKAGQAAVLSAAVSRSGTFADQVTFSCTGLPAGAACAFSPAAVNLATTAQATTAVTISTSAGGVARATHRGSYGGSLALILPPLVMAFAGLRGRTRRTKTGVLLAIAAAAIVFQACGGNASRPSAPANAITGTPAGGYTVTIVGTSSGTPAITRSQPFKLTVQ